MVLKHLPVLPLAIPILAHEIIHDINAGIAIIMHLLLYLQHFFFEYIFVPILFPEVRGNPVELAGVSLDSLLLFLVIRVLIQRGRLD